MLHFQTGHRVVQNNEHKETKMYHMDDEDELFIPLELLCALQLTALSPHMKRETEKHLKRGPGVNSGLLQSNDTS